MRTDNRAGSRPPDDPFGRPRLAAPAGEGDDVARHGLGVRGRAALRDLERGPRDLVEAGHGLRPGGGGEAHVVTQRGRRVGVAEPLLRLLDAVGLVYPDASSTR